MEQSELDDIIEKVANRSNLHSQDIPSLDLYIDQIMTLFDHQLEDNKRYEDDKLLTKTMVNNYSKAKVISPVRGKKYTKEQIIQMLMIYHLKNNLTIQEIKQILTPLYQDAHLESIYDKFIQIKETQSQHLQEFIHNEININQLHIDNQDEAILLMMALSSFSYQLTSVVGLIIDRYFGEE